VRTGGTSGQPLRFRADTFARRQKERAYLFDIWSQVGYQPHDLRLVYRGNVHGSLVRFNNFENAWVLSPSATIEQELDRLRRMVETLPPFFLHVYPSSLYTFIDLVGEDLFRRLPVRGILAASEAFPAGEQERFELKYGIAIAHWYGHSEYAILAYYCRQCGGYHFYPTYGHVELLPSEIEGCLRLIASSFNRIGTQFVRYDTGDLAVAPLGSCPANRFPRTGAIVGRSQETFIDSSGQRRSLGPYVFGIHGPFWDQIRDLQIVQDRPGCLRVRLVAHPGADQNQIRRTLERRMPMTRLEFEYVPRIERSPSGKRRYFVDGMPVADPNALASALNGQVRSRRAHRRISRRLITATVLAVAALAAALSFMAVRAGAGEHHATARPHHTDGPLHPQDAVTVGSPRSPRRITVTPWTLI
jgi:phenylacetate-CoA ligase